MKPETIKALDELRVAVAIQFGWNPDEVVMTISRCGEPMGYLACPDCGAPATWKDCEGCDGAGLIYCPGGCEGMGGEIVCSDDCFAKSLEG